MSIEPVLARAGGRAAAYVGRKALDKAQRERLAKEIRPLIAHETLKSFVDELTPAQARQFEALLRSAQFDHFALQTMSGRLTGASEADLAELRNAVRLSVRLRTDLADEQLTTATDLVVQLLTVATEAAAPNISGSAAGVLPKSVMVSVAADMAAATVRNSELMERLTSLKAIDRFATTMRSQVEAMRSRMRLTHLGNRSAVDYASLHVEPRFRHTAEEKPVTIGTLLHDCQRVVVLGDPGAGKSTFAAKLAHDIAGDRVSGLEGMAPFLLIVRNLLDAIREGRALVEVLESVAANPYNVRPPADAVEYLLLNGLAVVIIDGVDEFGDQAARQRLGELVEGFAHLYPTVNVVVTSREVGYLDAPLDSELFSQYSIVPFGDEQIRAYTENWFGLDAQSPASERDELVTSFLAESAGLNDLRRNPLMLSLLCSLYSSKHYIPRHRTEIYEQCAEMLFERWDSHRGIAIPMRFASSMRSAITRLAWMMFTEAGQGQVSRQRITEFLIDYMMEERFDLREDAAAAVEEFLDFCAGRAWVLAKAGTERHRPVYGFTHRTFLEYFAAVQLVRMGPSASEVWERLRPHVADASWRVVAQLAVQLLDRYSEGGASVFVSHLLAAPADPDERPARLGLAADIATQNPLRTAALRDLAVESVRLAGERPTDERWRYSIDNIMTLLSNPPADRPLATLLTTVLPENAPRLASYISDALVDVFDEAGQCLSEARGLGVLAGVVIKQRSQNSAVWREVRQRLRAEARLEELHRWFSLSRWPSPEDVRRFGAASLYKQAEFGYTQTLSAAASILIVSMASVERVRADGAPLAQSALASLYEPISSEPWPWLRRPVAAAVWVPENEGSAMSGLAEAHPSGFLELDQRQRSTAVLLMVPFIENLRLDQRPPWMRPFAVLADGRADESKRDAALRELEEWGLLPEAHHLTLSWLNGEASPIALEVGGMR